MKGFNIEKFQDAFLHFLVEYYDFSTTDAEDLIEHIWLTVDLEDLSSQHPFFLAAFIAGEELWLTNQKYLANRRKIDLIWL